MDFNEQAKEDRVYDAQQYAAIEVLYGDTTLEPWYVAVCDILGGVHYTADDAVIVNESVTVQEGPFDDMVILNLWHANNRVFSSTVTLEVAADFIEGM